MTSSRELFSKYRTYSDTLIETGTYHGNGIRCAISAGYKKIYSCDINEDYVKKAKQMYSNQGAIVENLESSKFLESILKDIDIRTVIFLDAHFWPENPKNKELGFKPDTVKNGIRPCPIVDELNVIKNHHIKDHVILIDDHQCFSTWMFENLSIESVDNLILTINPQYIKSIYSNVVCYEVK